MRLPDEALEPSAARLQHARLVSHVPGSSAAELILRRRSAVALDGRTAISTAQFYCILDTTRPMRAGFSAWPLMPQIDLCIFVHRVESLPRGLYFLHRSRRDLNSLRNLLHKNFRWECVHQELSLYLLVELNFEEVSKIVSCQQEIAGAGAFSLGMLGPFSDWHDSHVYREIFWEAGLIGQALYLAAEAQGLQGTGIGCYFDDAVHELLGLQTPQIVEDEGGSLKQHVIEDAHSSVSPM